MGWCMGTYGCRVECEVKSLARFSLVLSPSGSAPHTDAGLGQVLVAFTGSSRQDRCCVSTDGEYTSNQDATLAQPVCRNGRA